MIHFKSKLAWMLAVLTFTALAAGRSIASDLDDVMRDLDNARIERARADAADAELRSIEARRAAAVAQKNAQEAEFARFEAESRVATEDERARKAADDRAWMREHRWLRPYNGSYEHYEYRPSSGAYVEHYERW